MGLYIQTCKRGRIRKLKYGYFLQDVQVKGYKMKIFRSIYICLRKEMTFKEVENMHDISWSKRRGESIFILYICYKRIVTVF